MFGKKCTSIGGELRHFVEVVGNGRGRKEMILKKKYLVALAMVGIMTFAGCSSAPANTGSTNTTNTANKSEGGTTASSNTETTKEKVVLDFFYYDGLRVFRADSPLWTEIQNKSGVTLKGVAPTTPGGDASEQFNLMLASGEIADIIHTTKENIIKNGDKLFMPLEDLIAEHAPNLARMLEERPDVKAAATGTDGHIYFIPYLPDGEVSEVLFIRKDWLDKFDLAIPTTVAEYENALRIFREQDANGNGKKDEVGYFDRQGSSENGIAAVFNFYGASFEPYVENGVVKDDRYAAAFVEAVKNVSRIYKEGLIDPELYTRGKDSREVMIDANMGASTVDWIASTAKYQETYAQQIDGLEWLPIMVPEDPYGRVRTQYSRPQIFGGGWGISKNCKDPVEAIKLFDFMFTEEGANIMNFGIEGETYDMVDGLPQFKEAFLNADQPVNDQLRDMGYLQIGYPQNFEYERQWTNDLALAGIDLYRDANPFLDIVSNLGLTHTSEELDLISKKLPALKAYTEEMVQKWVVGSEDIDASFERYLKKVEELGAYDIIAAYQAAYDRAYQ